MALGGFARSYFKREMKCTGKCNEFDKNVDNEKGRKGNVKRRGKGNGKGQGKVMSPLDYVVYMYEQFELDARDRGPPSESESEQRLKNVK